MKINLLIAVGTALTLAAVAAQGQDSSIAVQLDEQAQRIRVLERKLELQDEANQTAARATPLVRATPKGFQFQSADGANIIKLRGVLHFDGRWFDDDITAETSDTWLLRRVRPTLEGTINRIYDFRFTPDFAGGRAFLLDGYVATRFQPWFTVQAGKFKVPVGLERLVSANDIRFIERAYPTSLLPNRDLGVQMTGDISSGLLHYSLGYFNGVTDGGSSDGGTPSDAENDTAGDFAGRIFVQPFINSEQFSLRGLGVGIAGTYVDVTGTPINSNLATYRTPGQQTLFQYRANTGTAPLNNATYADGSRTRVTPQAYYYFGNFGLLTEYARVSQDVSRQVSAARKISNTLDTQAWHVQVSWFLTGEEETFKGFTPGSTFSPGKPGTGALELVARHHVLLFDKDAFAWETGVGYTNSFANPIGKIGKATGTINPRKAKSTGIAFNWYLNEAFKWQVNYEVTKFTGGGANDTDQPDEKAILTRFAVGF
ncbi:MAG: porin [Candidatus Obscuribacterales bacterium]|nr:porin [Steroidobacteraceae bacterium]